MPTCVPNRLLRHSVTSPIRKIWDSNPCTLSSPPTFEIGAFPLGQPSVKDLLFQDNRGRYGIRTRAPFRARRFSRPVPCRSANLPNRVRNTLLRRLHRRNVKLRQRSRFHHDGRKDASRFEVVEFKKNVEMSVHKRSQLKLSRNQTVGSRVYMRRLSSS